MHVYTLTDDHTGTGQLCSYTITHSISMHFKNNYKT